MIYLHLSKSLQKEIHVLHDTVHFGREKNRYVLQIIKISINLAWWKNEMGLKYIATARTSVNYIYSYIYDIH